MVIDLIGVLFVLDRGGEAYYKAIHSFLARVFPNHALLHPFPSPNGSTSPTTCEEEKELKDGSCVNKDEEENRDIPTMGRNMGVRKK